jgi:hypothetical protein
MERKYKEGQRVVVNYATEFINEYATLVKPYFKADPDTESWYVRFENLTKEKAEELYSDPSGQEEDTFAFHTGLFVVVTRRECPKCERALYPDEFSDYLCRDCR